MWWNRRHKEQDPADQLIEETARAREELTRVVEENRRLVQRLAKLLQADLRQDC